MEAFEQTIELWPLFVVCVRIVFVRIREARDSARIHCEHVKYVHTDVLSFYLFGNFGVQEERVVKMVDQQDAKIQATDQRPRPK